MAEAPGEEQQLLGVTRLLHLGFTLCGGAKLHEQHVQDVQERHGAGSPQAPRMFTSVATSPG